METAGSVVKMKSGDSGKCCKDEEWRQREVLSVEEWRQREVLSVEEWRQREVL